MAGCFFRSAHEGRLTCSGQRFWRRKLVMNGAPQRLQ